MTHASFALVIGLLLIIASVLAILLVVLSLNRQVDHLSDAVYAYVHEFRLLRDERRRRDDALNSRIGAAVSDAMNDHMVLHHGRVSSVEHANTSA